jgi:hypothetical protein
VARLEIPLLQRTPKQTKLEAAGSDFVFQHLKEIAIDHQNGIFSGMNNYVQEIGGRPPMTVEQFVEKASPRIWGIRQ